MTPTTSAGSNQTGESVKYNAQRISPSGLDCAAPSSGRPAASAAHTRNTQPRPRRRLPFMRVSRGSGAGWGERDQVRHDLGGEEVDRGRRLGLAHVAERQPTDEVRARGRADLASDHLAVTSGRPHAGDAALAPAV